MNYYVRNLELSELEQELAGTGYESALDHIEFAPSGYRLTAPIDQISPLPSYRYAVTISLMALGELEAARETCPNLSTFVGVQGQTDVTYLFGRILSRMYYSG